MRGPALLTLKTTTYKMIRLKQKSPYLYLLPAVFLVLGAELVPVIYTTYLGFTRWDIIHKPHWIGLRNYIRIFSAPELLNALQNTLIWVIGTLIFPVGLALALAVLINRIKMRALFKAIFFIPTTLSPTVAGIIWRRVLATQKGAVNSILTAFGLSPYAMLTDSPLNTFLMIGAWTWQFLGLNLILFLVGLETVPKEPIEAAKVDGANSWQVFRYVTLPLLRPITMVVLANAIINTVRMFDIPWIMTKGGPGRASETLAISLYRESFLLFHMGLGSAIAVVISILTLILAWRFLRALTTT